MEELKIKQDHKWASGIYLKKNWMNLYTIYGGIIAKDCLLLLLGNTIVIPLSVAVLPLVGCNYTFVKLSELDG